MLLTYVDLLGHEGGRITEKGFDVFFKRHCEDVLYVVKTTWQSPPLSVTSIKALLRRAGYVLYM